MKAKQKEKRLVSFVLIVVLLFTMVPSMTKALAEGNTPVRSVTDDVSGQIGGQTLPLSLYQGGNYEGTVNAVSGSALTVVVNGLEKGITSWPEGNSGSVHVRYNSITGEVSNSVSNPDIFKSSATWAGSLEALGTGLKSWAPEDTNGDLTYLGGGIYAKAFSFPALASDTALSYKVAYNHGWNQGEAGSNTDITIPAGSTGITIFADTNTGYIADSITAPALFQTISLIGTVREAGGDDWNTAYNGFDFKPISQNICLFDKTFQTAGTYEYKYFNRSQDKLADGDSKTLTIQTSGQRVLFLYDKANGALYDTVNDYNSIAGLLSFPLSGETETLPDTFTAQPGGSSVWRVTGALGSYDSWNPGNAKTVMSHLAGEYYAKSFVLPAGTYEFKFTKNGSWDNAIGSDGINNNARNFTMTLTEKSKVNFYLNDELEGKDKVRTNITSLEEQGIKQYVPVLSDSAWPRLTGDLQQALGEGANWAPDKAKQMFVDYYFNNSVYKIQRTLPKGNYECKVVFGDSWSSPNYGGPDDGSSNLSVKVLDTAADVTFSIDTSAASKVLTHNYKPKDSLYDGVINKTALFFDSRDITYKKPFGAVKENSEDVTFRIAAQAGDAQLVKLELIDYNGISRDFNMSVATVLNGKDYWEVTVPKETFHEIGIWSYKFIVIDGSTKYEYGDDGSSGGTGAVSEDGQTPYSLTVYDSSYKTPDWMKNAVVYQIFPDRFYDGDTSNNHAKDKDGSRGDKVQLFEGDKWSALPENPRQSEEANKPYYPNAATDGVWSNEFYGGDIKGIEEKLSYLKTLGVTAVYLNPVSWAASNHKYDATDYKHLDPMFGEPVYNIAGDASSGLNYEATKAASDKVYANFSKACREVGIHLISDGVFNHVGDDSIYFDRYEKYPEIGAYEYWSRVWQKVETDKLTQAEAEKAVKDYYKSSINPATGKKYTDADFCYINWFKVGPEKVYDDKTGKFVRYAYEGWWGYDSLPVITAVEAEQTSLTNDAYATIAGAHEYNNVNYRENVIGYDLNSSNIANVTEAMKSANSQRWLYMGSGGWRLDVAPDVSDDTWRQFRTAVKSAAGKTDINGNQIEDPVILGEEWNTATKYLLGDMFDSVMNYQFRAALQGFLVNGGDALDLNNALEVIRENYPREAWQAMLNLVDSHDTVRNITKLDNPTWEEENTKNAPDASDRAVKLQALTAIFQLSYPGAPTIYYGDEVGVTGTKDPDSRRTYPWERVIEQSDGSYKISDAYAGTYGDLFNSYVKAAQVRNAHLDLFATGEIKTAYAKGEVIAYARKSADEGGLSLINRSEKDADITADVKDFLTEGLTLKDELGSGITSTVADGKIVLHVPGLTGLMMVSATKLTALPLAPAGVTATASQGTTAAVNIKWSSVEGAEGYYVYRTLLEGTEAVLLNSIPVTGTEYTDNTVTNGTRYYYYIKSVKDGILSISSSVATAMPSFKITEVTVPTAVPEVTIGVGKKTGAIEVKVTVPGLTDNADYKDKDVLGLTGLLGYYKEGSSRNSALFTRLRYEKDEGSAKVYSASFEPTEEGSYHYFARITVNNGYTYTESAENSMTAVSNFTQPAPGAPVLEQPVQESSRVTLKWSAAPGNQTGFEVYRTKVLAGNSYEEKIAVLEGNVTGYTDFLVSNDTTYSYRVAAFNSEYNRSSSNTVTVTPKLTMVEVTIRLHIPDKVAPSATDNIYVAGDANGWNVSGWQLKKPSGATDNSIVEYTFKMMSGKKLQYKYTRGTWATEALTSKLEGDTTSPGNYGYSSTDTNISAAVTNQGGNKMLINDYVLRWVDMPIMITVPRTSYNGQDIKYTTTDSSFNLQACVPYGGTFTINGKNINSIQAGALDSYGNVRLNNIPLSVGENTFTLHIEPTEATKALPWLTDTGRITSQMTASVNIKITRTKGSDNENPGNNNSNNNGSGNSGNPGSNNSSSSDKKEPGIKDSNVSGWENIKKELKDLAESMTGGTGAAHNVNIAMNKAVAVPGAALSAIKGKNINLILDYGTYTWTINGKSIQDKTALAEEYNLAVSDVTNGNIRSDVTSAVNAALKRSGLKNKNIQLRQLEFAQDTNLPFTASVTLTVPVKYAGKYLFLNYYNKNTKKIENAGYGLAGKDGKVNLTIKHLSSVYVLTTVNPLLPALAAEKQLSVGETLKLKPSNLLEGAKVTFKLSGKGAAGISKYGTVKGLKNGTAIITTKVVQAGGTYTYKTKIIVKAK